MPERDNREFMTRGDRRGEVEEALRYLRENLPPDVFHGLRFNSRKLSMHDAELIVRRCKNKGVVYKGEQPTQNEEASVFLLSLLVSS